MKKQRILMMIFFLLPGYPYASTHHPQDFLKKITGHPNESQAIVKQFCAVCHATRPEIPLGAPRMGETSDWQPRLKLGWGGLFANTNMGIGNMPPRGGCFECTDEQLNAAIHYLIEHKD